MIDEDVQDFVDFLFAHFLRDVLRVCFADYNSVVNQVLQFGHLKLNALSHQKRKELRREVLRYAYGTEVNHVLPLC